MQHRRTTTKGKPLNLAVFFSWFLGILAVILVVPWLLRYLKAQNAKTTSDDLQIAKDVANAENRDPEVQQTKADKITPSKNLQAAARALAYALGTHISVLPDWMDAFDPTGWTENDTEAANIVIKWSKPGNWAALQKLYTNIYSHDKNSLKADLLRLLDADQLKRIRKFVKI